LNYFSHYYFDHIPGEADHNFGLSFPDLVRNFIRGKRLKPLHESAIHYEKYPMLSRGTQKHFTRDAQFHGSEYFKSTEEKLNRILQPVFQSLEIGRYWFASHLLAEMMLDRVLMKKHPQLLDNYYHDMAKANPKDIADYLQISEITEHDPFFERMERFMSSQYLRQYVHDPALIYSLNRIYIFTGAGSEWSKEQYTELQNTIPEAESIIFESLDHLMQEMK
jgi:hypothetical protein